jgi:KDO2-lipid IV(A) lauroyltransferase
MLSKILAKLILAFGAGLPTATVRWLARLLGRAVFWIPAARRGLLLNAKHILGETSSPIERRSLALGVLDSFALAISDLVLSNRLWKDQLEGNVDTVPSNVEIENYDTFARLNDRETHRGFVMVTLHMGSYEAACMLLAQKRGGVTIVYHRDPAGFFEELRSRQRTRFPIEEKAIDTSPFFAVDLLQRLREGGTVLLAGEIAQRLHGESFPFLDGSAHFSLWPARLAVTAGVPVLPAFIVRTGVESYCIHIEDPVECQESDDPRAVMEKLVKVFESYVQRYPDQWLMVRPFWDDATAVNQNDPPGGQPPKNHPRESGRNPETRSASRSSHG